MTLAQLQLVENTQRHDTTLIDTTATASAVDASGRRVPVFVPRRQLYYWSHAWQAMEDEALREIAQGRTMTFESGADASAWLLKDDD